jgi:hypothetical protein
MVGVGSGTCTESCNDSYQTAVPGFADGLRQEWHRVQIDFADLHQLGFGRSEPWDPTTAISLQWSVTAYNATVQNEPFQFCVDQVELVP